MNKVLSTLVSVSGIVSAYLIATAHFIIPATIQLEVAKWLVAVGLGALSVVLCPLVFRR